MLYVSLPLLREGINHFVVYHEVGTGLVAYNNKGRPSNAVLHQRLHCPEDVERDIMNIRIDLGVVPGVKLLLLLSLATDDMVRLVAMHPEVWFGDCTGSTNKQKRDLYLMAIRTVSGRTFPGNLTVVPSGCRWVFMCLYKLAFVALYTRRTCSRNRLYLTDDDNAEYGPYENLIATNQIFGMSTVMLCIFHAVWQPFREKVFSLLPKHPGKSKMLTEVGENWGELCACLYCYTFRRCELTPSTLVAGNYLYNCFQRQCCVYESKIQYDRSHAILSQVLELQETVDAVGQPCVNAVKELQMSLMAKERYLAHHIRRKIPMCLQAMTTSPVESMNKIVKYGQHKLDSNMNLSTGVRNFTKGVDERILGHDAEAQREMGMNNRASQAPTKYDIIRKAQLLMDIQYDSRKHMKCAQTEEEEWICWNFYVEEDMTILFPWTYKAEYHQVRTISIRRRGDKVFAHCDCLLHHTDGIPCRCFFRLFGKMEASMVNIQHLKCYSPHYGYDDDLGKKLVNAQREQEEFEGYGIPITEELVRHVKALNQEKVYPFTLGDTTENDLKEAQFVLDREETMATTHSDLDRYRSGDTTVNDEDDYVYNIAALSDYHISLSERTQALHRNLAVTNSDTRPRYAQTPEQKTDSRKRMCDNIDAVLDHPDVSIDGVDFFDEGIKKLKREIIKRNKKRKKSTKLSVSDSTGDIAMDKSNVNNDRGCDGAISDRVDEIYLARDGQNMAVGEVTWAATTSRRGPKEVRKKNVLN